ncbi:serine hydrolase [Chitinophaga horti]|uniref:beta-N-acetylhexosaminidase n=1 Tax=Chitinophaga horti TaxID=2920382 RepID=A0ABY6J009_9BACT|nr:glycoside hydrolase family 3 N-terminal domain-containing protein [Chitinophaga horti]UYQ92878.1 serine hydrolase [Chitinophaga horti]
MRKIFLAMGFTGLLMVNYAAPVHVHDHAFEKEKKKKEHPTRPAQRSAADQWADSVFNSLSHEERIAQLIMIRAHSNFGQDHINAVIRDIRNNKVGGLVFFQGGPARQANLLNAYQAISKVPLLVAIDGEWGLGMRLDSAIAFPRNLMLGAVQDSGLIYEIGQAIGEQCKRVGVNVNFAPVVDVNNNPNNPVINDRSFGEDKYQVARMGIAMIKGMQDVGVMACAKHFPGHGDTDTDSHYDLPLIKKSLAELDSLEIYPFKRAIDAGVGMVMVAHLNIPALDKRANTPSSISPNVVTKLLQKDLGFDGLIVTDALEMQGIAKYHKNGQESLQSLLAGNHLMELPSTSKGSIDAIAAAIRKGQISKEEVYKRVKKVLRAKYELGLGNWQPINTTNIAQDINVKTMALRKRVSEAAITLLRNDNNLMPFSPAVNHSRKLAVLAVGADGNNTFLSAVKEMKPDVDTYIFSSRMGEAQIAALVQRLKNDYSSVIVSLHNYSRRPANDFGIPRSQKQLINQLQQEMPTATVLFGNPYAAKFFCDASTIITAYEDDSTTQRATAEVLFGRIVPKGKLPVTVCTNFKFGDGITEYPRPVALLEEAAPESVGMNSQTLMRIDSLAYDMIAKGAAPGCSIVALKDGKLIYNKSFGHYDYSQREAVTPQSIYDLASVTKICATTISVMRLYDEGRLHLDSTLGAYLPWTRGTDKQNLRIRDVLLHQAGLVSYIPFYKEAISPNGYPDTLLFRAEQDSMHTLRVAEHLYMQPRFVDTMFSRILTSKLAGRSYIYSDNDFIFLGKVVEQITGKTLDRYVKEAFYDPLGMTTTGFQPRERFPLSQIVPTEFEHIFRIQWIRGDVHDPGAAMFGGVAGHAGLFSDAYDLGILLQMLANGGSFNGIQYIKPETIKLFTAYNTDISRRGLGFDKPEKDNSTRRDAYPSKFASPQVYGHTGFTGTCVWVDPQYNLVFVYLSNRVTPNGGANTKISSLNVRGNIMDVLYQAMASR